MKRFATFIVGVALAISAMAEASFDQIQSLIQQQQYSAAANGLEVIIQNHPKSAKAFYAMAQAQAGMGNLEKARKALDIATGLNPALDFAPASSVASLREAITPQVKKIEYVDTSHTVRNLIVGILLFSALGVAIVYMFKKKQERDEKESAERAEAEMKRAEAQAAADRAQVRKENEAREALRKHPNYGNPQFDPLNPDVLKPRETAQEQKRRVKAEADALALREARARAEAAEEDARQARIRATTPAPTTTVVNSGSSTGDFAMGMVLGNMMGSSHHHSHDTERTVVRETVGEVHAPSRDSSWDDTPAKSSSRSSSWDSDSSSSSSRSSSWDDDSSSKSSSSWSSSSSSDSSSSWSSSDSSSSSSSSSSSWD